MDRWRDISEGLSNGKKRIKLTFREVCGSKDPGNDYICAVDTIDDAEKVKKAMMQDFALVSEETIENPIEQIEEKIDQEDKNVNTCYSSESEEGKIYPELPYCGYRPDFFE